MKLSIFTELQMPRPWQPDGELKLFQEALEQVELADKLGYHAIWCVEHHFLEEYAHCSSPEVFLAACSQRAKQMRVGHAVMLLPPAYNPCARAAERIGTLDCVSAGRVEFGTGESSSEVELGGFGVPRDQKREMWHEALGAICRMFVETPFEGHDGKYLKMPVRNVVPKPVQKPHPPVWVACSRRETILLAARHGIGALTFAFVSPEESRKWVHDYYQTLADDCEPIAFAVNANIALSQPMTCGPTRERAIAMDRDGSSFFVYAVAYYYAFSEHDPGKSSIWESYEGNRDAKINTGFGESQTGGGIPPLVGSPAELRKELLILEEAGVDQILLGIQGGRNKHEDICESLERFGREVLPEFHERDARLCKHKEERLAPIIEKAMKRRRQPQFPKASGPRIVKAAGGLL